MIKPSSRVAVYMACLGILRAQLTYAQPAPADPGEGASGSSAPSTEAASPPDSGNSNNSSGPANGAASPAAPSPTGGRNAAAAADKLELARVHFLRAVQFFNDGDFKLSLVEFRRAYEISGNYRVLYNIGQVNHQLSNYTKALAALERYLAEGRDEVPDDRRAEVLQSINELRKKVARVRLQSNVNSFELRIDDVSQGQVNPGQVIVVDAGDHHLELRQAGYLPATAQVSLAAGESSELSLNLAPAPLSQPPMAEGDSKASPRRGTGLIWLGWFVTGATAVGAGVTGLIAQKHAKDLHTLRDSPNSSAEERESAGDRARSFAIASDAMTGVAIAVGAVSLYFTLSSGGSKRGRAEPSTRLAVSSQGVALAGGF